ncbi:MAG: hypothetical protein HC865_10185 [Cyanobacteria bacterium RU_5_0]|nr:hypothetical protein [Cyanobacteria bacterium RU_5_0]
MTGLITLVNRLIRADVRRVIFNLKSEFRLVRGEFKLELQETSIVMICFDFLDLRLT